MKTMTKISVLLNAGLLGTAVFLWEHPRTVPVSAPAIPAVAATVEPESAPAPAVQTVVAPFHWSQLMSTNGYRSFVANLRAAGCPESTVEDIVRGNIQRAFDWKRGELHVDGSEPGPWSAQAQAQMVAYFLGQSPNAQETVEVAEGSSAVAASEKPMTAALVPIQDIEPATLAALNLSDEQKQMISEVQQTYAAALNGQKQIAANASQSSQSSQPSQDQANDTTQNSQNPLSATATSPNASRAQTGLSAAQLAQLNADNALEGALGSDGYLGYTMAQDQTALENQLKEHPSWVSGDAQ
jgi:hypothetical protein